MPVGVPEVDAAVPARGALQHPDAGPVAGEYPGVAAAALPQQAVLTKQPEHLPRHGSVVALDDLRVGVLVGFAEPFAEGVPGDMGVVLPDDVHGLVYLLGGDHASAAGVVMIQGRVPCTACYVEDFLAGLHPPIMPVDTDRRLGRK